MKSILDKLARELGHRGDTGLELRITPQAEIESDWRNWRWWIIRIYRVACFGAGMVLLELSLLDLELATAKAGSLFVLLNIGAALHTVSFSRSRKVSFHFILTYANFLLFGPGLAALGSGVGVFGFYLLFRKKPLSQAMFQMGRSILAIMGAGFVYKALGGRWGVVNLTWASIVLSVMTYMAIGFILEVVSLVWFRKVWLWHLLWSYLWMPLAYLIFVPTSISIFYIYFPYGMDGVLLFLVPVATFALALELFARSSIANRSLAIVQDISGQFSSILDPDQLVRKVLELIGRTVDFVWGIVWIKSPTTGILESRISISATGEERPVPGEPPAEVMTVSRKGRPAEFSTSFSESEHAFGKDISLSVLAIPISSRDEVLGVLSLGTAEPGGYTSRERRLLEALAGNVAIAIQNAQLYKKMEYEAVRDGLTRLYNHRFLQETLVKEEAKSRRHERPFSIIILDIDHFKIYNDTYGHPAGDKLLIALAEILMRSVRDEDSVTRYGGEEFAIVLPECAEKKAVRVAERIRKNVEEFPNPHREDYNLTISAGVASFPISGDSKRKVLEEADKALYRAKREGRNRVCW